MKIKIFASFLILLMPLVFVGHVFAADITIVCDESGDSSDCKVTSESNRLFNESNWAPGQTISRSIQVINNDHNDDCDLKMSTNKEVISPAGFTQITFTAIKRDGNLLFGDVGADGKATPAKDLQDVFDSSYIDFGEVSEQGGVAIYDWLVTFDKDAGNEYQGANVSFDFGINFECDHSSSSSSDSDDDDTTSVAGASSVSPFAFFGGGTVPELVEGVIAGASTESAQISNQTGEVGGTKTCRDTWLFWFLLSLQFILLFIISRRISGFKSKLIYIVLSVLTLPLIYYLFLCEKRYALLSLAISLFWYLFKKKN